ncbi:hypothetical protein N7454_001862 [Penicillium verhagenii]|nr:hypothetical protein N7454_001862 [Penicillium verhagenii]
MLAWSHDLDPQKKHSFPRSRGLDMGFLSAAELIECSASDLISSYQGQTGQRVADWLERALGKVLFIDEAYRLAAGGYEQQAVDELVDRLTKSRYAQRLVVILAGYDDEMAKLMQVNRGLQSRFPTEIVFHSLTPNFSWQLLRSELKSQGIEILGGDSNAQSVMIILAKLIKLKSWANARHVKQLAADLVLQAFSQLGNDGSLHLSVQKVLRRLELAECEMLLKEAEVMAASLTSQDKDWPIVAERIARSLYNQYEMTRKERFLEAAITRAEEAVAATPKTQSRRPALSQTLSLCLSVQYERSGKLEDLDSAITHGRYALSATTAEDRASFLTALSQQLLKRYERTKNYVDLKTAISLAQQSVTATPIEHSDRAARLMNLSFCLFNQYDQIGNLEDLEAAISHSDSAIAGISVDNIDRRRYLNHHSNVFCRRYLRKGNSADLKSAIRYAQEAVSATPVNHPDRVALVGNLSRNLEREYMRTANSDHIQAAIKYNQDELATIPIDHSDRADLLNNLSDHLFCRYEQIGDLDDLKAAISYTQESIAATPLDHLKRSNYLSSLASRLMTRFWLTDSLNDLDDAIRYSQNSLTTTSAGHPDRASLLDELSIRLCVRYERNRNADDLEHAVRHSKDSVAATSGDHCDRASRLNNLAHCLSARYQRTGNSEDLEAAVKCYTTAVSMSTALPSARLRSARQLLGILMEQSRWAQASKIAKVAEQLLPLLCGCNLSREDQQYEMLQTAALAADIGTVLFQAQQPSKAIQQLELGRGLILGYLMDSRSDLKQLHSDHPDLSIEYERLRSILAQPLTSAEPTETSRLMKDKQRAPRDIDRCLASIREHSKHKNFLREPAISDILAGSSEGPVVICNITEFGSHAAVIADGQIHAVELPPIETSPHEAYDLILHRFAIERQARPQELQRVRSPPDFTIELVESLHSPESLSWLWEQYVNPIINVIETQMSPRTDMPRVWWIGTGVASHLPFHAAGNHGTPQQTTMGRMVSSYTPTVQALIHSRSQLSKLDYRVARPSMVMAIPADHPQGFQSEIEAIQQAASSAFTIQVHQHSDDEALLQAMQETDIRKFAWDGSPNPSNSPKSQLPHQKYGISGPLAGQLTGEQISDQILHRARIAFSSGCSTPQIWAESFSYEAIHLASALQVAGFGHVVASLWPVDDTIRTAVVWHFYSLLTQHALESLSSRLVAESLHTAVQRIREKESSMAWASFVHYGP